jgi:hypothetical protein
MWQPSSITTWFMTTELTICDNIRK